ncbi:helicase [Ligilactobacillus salitolerans]|uniref:Helicase n=1 Tax=Ligilactobacillus salitolerans TaxID=1808352 RepID=A0A401IVQ8_9LACO|nr:DEAD/DEAH box helicase [Ligilactobacillus salitolerans]GBG95609.1 helicase [Ligilactobacillus salitolerans]
MNENHDLSQAILHGLLDQQRYSSNEMLAPKLLVNTAQETIWEHLLDEFETCLTFSIAVAFITRDMLTPFKAVLSELASKGVHGSLLTSDYLGFNEPEMFAELLKIPNLTVKVSQNAGFHVKGYIFEQENEKTLIIGSANLTRSAMLKNYEWNLRLTASQQGALVQQVEEQFALQWGQAVSLTPKWLENYQENYVRRPQTFSQAGGKQKITPNQMQREALARLDKIRQKGARRALLISATGTGKTYLGAFDVQAFAPKRFLFVVHREQILEAARASFFRVLGGRQEDYGILSGRSKQTNAKYVFATVQTLSKASVMQQFAPDEFEYLLIDEAHRSGAASYLRILEYFTPRFVLGMTATPERTDDFDVFELFDHNLAYEIRLQQALEEKMLTPFHYVGVTDYEYAGKMIDETTSLSRLVANERVDHVLAQINYYTDTNQTPHGLIFCSRQDEAQELAQLLTERQHPSRALTNEQSIAQRDQAVKDLENGRLEYLVTVNIFNEGIDIPCVDQVILLRNTQSSIVFIQQLGRGLRKYPGKEYVTVIDFIGNYKNNYLIPMALHDDRSKNKDNAKRELAFKPILGLSTINFSPIAKQRIFAALDQVKLDSLHQLKQAYYELKQRLGRVPLLCDYLEQGTLSPQVFFNNKRLPHYGAFLGKVKEKINLTQYQAQLLSFVSQELAPGKRPHELLLLQLLLKEEQVSEQDLISVFKEHNCYYNEELFNSLDLILSLQFFAIKAGKKLKSQEYGGLPLVEHDGFYYRLAPDFKAALQAGKDFKRLLDDAIECGLQLNKEYDSQQQFTLYQRYSRKDVCRLLNWSKDLSAPMYGYWVGEKECPIFITYHKDKKAVRSKDYRNSFADNSAIKWYSRSPRTLESAEIKRLLARDGQGRQILKLHLFAKRSDAEGQGYTYLGLADIAPDSVQETQLAGANGRPKKVVQMELKFRKPLPYQQLKFLTETQDVNDGR